MIITKRTKLITYILVIYWLIMSKTSVDFASEINRAIRSMIINIFKV
jgi:hypothetical protein